MLVLLLVAALALGFLWMAITASRWRSSRIKRTDPVLNCIRTDLGKYPTAAAKVRYSKWLTAQSSEEGRPS